MSNSFATSKSMSRRSLLAGGAAAIGAAALGVATANAEAPVAIPESWDYEADVVVLGFGNAGTGATFAAADAGADVVVVEKAPRDQAGGGTLISHGNFVVSETNADPESSFRMVRGSVDYDVVEQIVSDLPLFDEWCEQYPIEGFNPTDGSLYPGEGPNLGWPNFFMGTRSYIHYNSDGGCMAQVRAAILDLVEARDNITVLYDAPARHFVRNPETGEVIGVQADQDGTPVYIKARQGVVLATGNVCSNPEMLAQLCYPGVYIASMDSPYATGDGFYMAAEIGAKIWGFYPDSACFYGLCLAPASREIGTGIEWKTPAAADAHCIMVNRAGERFVNEMRWFMHTMEMLPQYQYTANMMNEWTYKNSPFWLVFDQEYMDTVRLGTDGESDADIIRSTWNGMFHEYLWSEDNSAELEKGWIVSADTLEELAAKMTTETPLRETVTCDAAGLVATVEAYNAACDAGEDVFERSADSLQKIGDGPYYAIELCEGVMYTSGGPAMNTDYEIVDPQGEAIGRALAAGTVSFAFENGNNVATFAAGIAAGKKAAALQPWE